MYYPIRNADRKAVDLKGFESCMDQLKTQFSAKSRSFSFLTFEVFEKMLEIQFLNPTYVYFYTKM